MAREIDQPAGIFGIFIVLFSFVRLVYEVDLRLVSDTYALLNLLNEVN